MMLTLLASVAQEESRSISENVKWSIRKKFQNGVPNGHKAPYGYEWSEDAFVVIPSQGEIVKEIYRRYLDGESAYGIAKDLARRGIKGQSGHAMRDSTIKNILGSISYTGVMHLQKNYISDNHKRHINRGELPMYAVEDMFEPLVSKEDFDKVQTLMHERAELRPNKKPKLTAFSGITKCGMCGCSISRRTSKYGKKWICNTKERKHTCDFRDIYESELEAEVSKMLGLERYDENTAKKQIRLITIDNGEISLLLNNGVVKHTFRNYKKGYSGFSKKIFCGCCGSMLEADTWRMGHEKEKHKVWICRNCLAKRLFDSTLRKGAAKILGRGGYEGIFARDIEKAINYDDRIEFYYKEGSVAIWQKR